MENWTYAIVKNNKNNKIEDDNDYAPRVTVFAFSSEDAARGFRESNRGIIGHLDITRRGDPAIPAYGAEGVQYEMHNF